MSILLGLLLWIASGPSGATELTLSISPEDPQVAARPYARFLDDPEQALTLNQVRAMPERFLPAAQRGSHLGNPAMHWVRLPLANGGRAAGRWVLALGVPDAEVLEVYRVGGEQVIPLVSLGWDADFAERPLPERMLGVPVELAAGERVELYLRYRTHADTPLSLELLSPERFQKQLAEGNFVNGAVIGILLALTLFALLQYLALGQTAFLVYVVLASLLLSFVLEFEGYAFEYLWPTHGAWNQAAPICLALGIHIAHAVFAIALFDLRRAFPRLYRAYLVYLALPLLSFFLYLLVGWVWPALLTTLVYVPLVFVAGTTFLRRGLPAAGLFLVGVTAVTLFGSVLFGLSVSGFALFGVSPFAYPKIGYVLESMFFAMALARQVQVLRRRLEDGLRRHLAEAEQLARAEAERHRALIAAQQQQLQLAAAGHDLSQPLTSIRFALAALRVQTGNEAATRLIDKSLDYTEGLLRTLIDDAKRDYAGRDQGIDLEDAFADAHRRHLPAAQRKALRLRYRPNGYRVEGSGVVLGRILDNFISNAIRYTERGHILLGVRRRADGLEIQVLDSGPGFDTAKRDKLLAPFQQSGSLAAERLGHGLGLHIVHALCVQSGYRLTISAKPGRGSAFGVVIPFKGRG